jgi:uncharacterized membrane protein
MVLSTSAKVSVGSNAAGLLVMALAWAGFPSEMPLPYAVHKVLHIVGVIIFMGNLIAGPLWIIFAYYEDGRRHFPFAVRTLVAADIWLTTPGLQLTIWNGLCLAAFFGGARTQPWLVESLGWLLLTSLWSLVLVLPWQERLLAAVEAGDETAQQRALIQWAFGARRSRFPCRLSAG